MMNKRNYKKTIALTSAALSVFEIGAMCGNVVKTHTVLAAERQVTTSKITLISQGTEVSKKDLTATITDKNVTTSSAVTVTLNEDIFVDNIIDSHDELKKALAINAGLEHVDTINVNLKVNNLDIDKEIELTEGNNAYLDSSWTVDLGDDEYDNIITVTFRTKELTFTEQGINYVIPGFSYTTTVNVAPQYSGNDSGVIFKSVDIEGVAQVGETLRAKVIDVNDNIVDSDVAYRWYRYDEIDSPLPLEVGQGPEYKVQKDDEGKYIKLSAINDVNSIETITGKIAPASSSDTSNGGGSSNGSGSSSGGGSSSGSGSSSGGGSSSGSGSSNGSSSSNEIGSSNVSDSSSGSNSSNGTTIKTDLNGTTHLVDASGNPATGWQQIGTEWYLGEADGKAATGWNKVGETWYYMNNSGAMTTGWQKVNGSWYYMNNSGAMTTGWLNDNGTWYYLNADGSMASNTYVDGYYLGNDGAWVR